MLNAIPLVDVHAHLDHALFDKDLDEVLKDASSKGVKAVITNGTNPASNKHVLTLAKKYPLVKVALGLYPIDALGKAPDADGLPHPEEAIDVDSSLADISTHKEEIVAIGEVGLDYKFDVENHDLQKKTFEKIISLSKRIRRPLVVHSRKAEADVVSLLESLGVKQCVLHCFCGGKKLIAKAADLGCSFSIPANVVKSQHFQMLTSMVPISQLLTETDSPWLSPTLGERNVPQNVWYSVQEIARIKGLDMQEAANIIFKNYVELFGTP